MSQQPFSDTTLAGGVPSYDEVLQELIALRAEEAELNWRIGDLCKWLADPKVAAKDTGFARSRLTVAAEVARAFKPEDRDRDLSWSYFSAVKNLPHEQAIEMLAKAEDENLGLVKFGRLLRNEPDPEGALHECLTCGRKHRGHVPDLTPEQSASIDAGIADEAAGHVDDVTESLGRALTADLSTE